MTSINENELSDLIRFPSITTPTSNYIISNVQDVNGIIRRVPMISEITNYEYYKMSDIGDRFKHNVVLDMSKTSVEELLNKALEVVNSPVRYTFNGRSNYSLAVNALRKLRKNVQYIFYNAGSLSYDDVRRFNELINLSTFYMNQIVLLQPGEDLATYQTTDKFGIITKDVDYKRLELK